MRFLCKRNFFSEDPNYLDPNYIKRESKMLRWTKGVWYIGEVVNLPFDGSRFYTLESNLDGINYVLSEKDLNKYFTTIEDHRNKTLKEILK